MAKFPWNLMEDIFNEPEHVLKDMLHPLAPRFIEMILHEYSYKSEACNLRADVLTMHYYKNMNWTQLAESTGKSNQRCRQAFNEMLRYLRKPIIRGILKNGIVGFILEDQKLISANSMKLGRRDGYLRGYEDGFHAAKRGSESDMPLLSNRDQDVGKSDMMYDMICLDELNLPTRCYNAFHRAGFRTLTDIMNCGVERIIFMPNIGKKTFKDLMFCLKEFGVDTSPLEEDEYYKKNLV